MILRELELRFFRSHQHLTLHRLGLQTLILGPNGSGKTNILEAIAYLGGVRLRAMARERDLIQFGAPGFRIQARVRSIDGREADIEARVEGPSRRLLREGHPTRPGSEGLPAVVTFTPDDLNIVKGGPEERRRVLEQDIGTNSLVMRDLGNRYLRTLKQRNALLAQVRDARSPASALEPWDVALCEVGGHLQALRALAVRALMPVVAQMHERLAPDTEDPTPGSSASLPDPDPVNRSLGEGVARFEILYRPSGSGTRSGEEVHPESQYAVSSSDPLAETGEFPDLETLRRRRTQALAASLANVRRAEWARGYSLVGPHRDDLEFLLHGRNMRLFASQGQQRTAVIALKGAIVAWVKQSLGEAPILLLDDVLSELDAHRQRQLRTLWGDVQTFVTSAEENLFWTQPGEDPDAQTVVRLGGAPETDR